MRKSLPHRVILTIALAALGLLPAACSKQQPPPQVAYAPVSSGSVPSATPSGTTPPGGQPMPVATGADPITLAADAALDVAMLAQADREAPGMKPEGQPLRVTMKENDLSAMIVTLQPNHCYTFIAMSGPLQVSDLEIHLMLLPFNVEAQRSLPNTRNPAFIGRGNQPSCPVVPIPIQYRVDVIAKKGSGRVVAQMFARPK